MVRVLCPHCQHRYRTELEAFGQTAVCTHCHTTFRIGDARPPFNWKPEPDLVEDSWIGVEVPEEKPEARHCAFCEALLEPRQVVCPACGRHQVTGIVHKVKAPPPPDADRVPLHAYVPWRVVALAAVVLLLVGGVVWIARSVTKSVVQVGEELTDQLLINQAVKDYRGHRDRAEIARRYRGRIDDTTLPRAVSALTAADPLTRETAIALIGCGAFTRLDLLLEAADSRSHRDAVLEALDAMGPARLVQLSNHDKPEVRRQAADAMIALYGLPRDEKTAALLSKPVSALEKVETLNELCGRRREATGPFVVWIGRTASPFEVQVVQVGRVFFLQAGSEEFRTSALGSSPAFEIPVEQWCRATDTAVDVEAIRAAVTGSIRLTPSSGAGWSGTLILQGHRDVPRRLPGFVPVDPPARGQRVDAPVRLARPQR